MTSFESLTQSALCLCLGARRAANFLHIVPLVRATYLTFTAREQTLSDPYSYRVTVLVYKP